MISKSGSYTVLCDHYTEYKRMTQEGMSDDQDA